MEYHHGLSEQISCQGNKTGGGVKEQPPALRDTTPNLVEAILLDVWPRRAAIVDFGLKSQEHYEALYYPLREGEITPEQLDAALGKGEKLTALVARHEATRTGTSHFAPTGMTCCRSRSPTRAASQGLSARPARSRTAPRSGGERASSPGGIADGRDGPESPEPGNGTERGAGASHRPTMPPSEYPHDQMDHHHGRNL